MNTNDQDISVQKSQHIASLCRSHAALMISQATPQANEFGL